MRISSWRIPFSYLEERDQYFTDLKNCIAETAKKNGSPVVLICHSMGNRVIQYFLNMVKKQEGGEQWIKHNIHTMLAIGAPWLGKLFIN
jgi:triacylglycerol esterase/lipase EstA (alpha/beta hydrolase family)